MLKDEYVLIRCLNEKFVNWSIRKFRVVVTVTIALQKNITRVARALIKTDSTSSFTIISIVALIISSFKFSLW